MASSGSTSDQERKDDVGLTCLDDSNDGSDNSSQDKIECAVCLQTCIQPVRLPCSHIFCYLCVKGVTHQSKRCAMCRQEIPPNYLDHPDLISVEPPKLAFEGSYQWFYEGKNGWWQYDERTSTEIEAAFKNKEKQCEVLIAGFLYVIDFENNIQFRRCDPSRRRKIKRDLISIPKKGIAGIRLPTKTDASTESYPHIQSLNLSDSDNSDVKNSGANQDGPSSAAGSSNTSFGKESKENAEGTAKNTRKCNEPAMPQVSSTTRLLHNLPAVNVLPLPTNVPTVPCVQLVSPYPSTSFCAVLTMNTSSTVMSAPHPTVLVKNATGPFQMLYMPVSTVLQSGNCAVSLNNVSPNISGASVVSSEEKGSQNNKKRKVQQLRKQQRKVKKSRKSKKRCNCNLSDSEGEKKQKQRRNDQLVLD